MWFTTKGYVHRVADIDVSLFLEKQYKKASKQHKTLKIETTVNTTFN
jgi:hypothetical protein